MFYSVANLSNSVLKKASKSFYEKDKVFVNLYNQLEEKIFIKSVIFIWNLDEKVLILSERLRKIDAPGNLYKASTDNIPFLIEM